MPKHFTAEQFAVSAAVGDLLTQKSFGGDTQAWHTYQDTVLSKLHPGALPAGNASRPDVWKAAARHLKKIEAERKKVADADADADRKKLKVSTRWQKKHVPDLFDAKLGSPRPSACGTHVVWQLSARFRRVDIYGEYSYSCTPEDVRYDLPPSEGESDEEAKMRADRHRHREQVALQWIVKGYKRQPFQVHKKRKTK